MNDGPTRVEPKRVGFDFVCVNPCAAGLGLALEDHHLVPFSTQLTRRHEAGCPAAYDGDLSGCQLKGHSWDWGGVVERASSSSQFHSDLFAVSSEHVTCSGTILLGVCDVHFMHASLFILQFLLHLLILPRKRGGIDLCQIFKFGLYIWPLDLYLTYLSYR